MDRKPRDILEFLRRQGPEPAGEPAAPRPEAAGPRVVFVRKSQVAVAAAAAGLAVLLAFLLGLAAGSPRVAPAPAAGPPAWVLRVATFKDSEEGMVYARNVGLQLADLDEVTYNRVLSKEQLVVGLGSWLKDPARNPRALELRDRVRSMRAKSGERPYADADFWMVPR